VILTLAIALTTVCGGGSIQGVTPEAKISKAAENQGKYIKTIEISNASGKVIDEKLGTEEAAEINDSMTDEEALDAVADSINDATEASDMAIDMTNVALLMYMKSMAYGKDADISMYDFFMRDDLKNEEYSPVSI